MSKVQLHKRLSQEQVALILENHLSREIGSIPSSVMAR